MTPITLIPEVPVDTKGVVVFDTNAYRVLTYGLTLENARARAVQLRDLERPAGETALANPLVVWELLTHLAESSDPAYANCLNALVALGEHTREPQTGKIAMTTDSECVVCHCLFNKIPLDAEANVTSPAGIACHIRDHAPSITDPVVVSNIAASSREMENGNPRGSGTLRPFLTR
jgi:hypothetical protein